MARETVEERFWRHVDKTEGGCWLWTGQKWLGRGYFNVAGRNVKAHRYAYELLVGPIPDGLTIDHLCATPACVNPEHLEPVTLAVNISRNRDRNTHCRRGHAYTPSNTYEYTRSDGYRGRQCRACNRLSTLAAKRQTYIARSGKDLCPTCEGTGLAKVG